MNQVGVSGLLASYRAILKKYSRKPVRDVGETEPSFLAVVAAKQAQKDAGSRRKSVVDAYISQHPENASHVKKQVRDGKAVREKNGAGDVNTGAMSMEEYQIYFYALLSTIPYDATRVHDDVTILISDAGWEQMKMDPDYEAWILGYFVEDRAVRNPFFGMGGNGGSIVIERFGASIEEHHGEGVSKPSRKNRSGQDEESWWDMRQRRRKELRKKQWKQDLMKARAKRAAEQKLYWKLHMESQQRMQEYFEERLWKMRNGTW